MFDIKLDLVKTGWDFYVIQLKYFKPFSTLRNTEVTSGHWPFLTGALCCGKLWLLIIYPEPFSLSFIFKDSFFLTGKGQSAIGSWDFDLEWELGGVRSLLVSRRSGMVEFSLLLVSLRSLGCFGLVSEESNDPCSSEAWYWRWELWTIRFSLLSDFDFGFRSMTFS